MWASSSVDPIGIPANRASAARARQMLPVKVGRSTFLVRWDGAAGGRFCCV